MNLPQPTNQRENTMLQPDHPLESCVSSSILPSYDTSTWKQWLVGMNKLTKGVVLILLWNAIVGMIDSFVQLVMVEMAISVYFAEQKISFKVAAYICYGLFGALALSQMIFYPLSGLLADIKYGRYKVIIFSLTSVSLSLLILCIAGVFLYIDVFGILVACTAGIGAILVLVGSSGFHSNAVQFGLDQLLDSPSKKLTQFIWLYVWTSNFGEMVMALLGSLAMCQKHLRYYLAITIPAIILVSTSSLLLVTCYKASWFYCERKTHNPYKMIYQGLKFVAKNKHPLRRSALTYCGDEIPSRMDFAKMKYGGKFTTEAVEDIKTFLRVLLMLFIGSSIYYYIIPGTFTFIIYSLHLGRNQAMSSSNPHCYSEWVILQSGNLRYIVTFIAIPLYLLVFQSCVEKYLSRILQRLIAGIIIMVVFMWTVTILYAAALTKAEQVNCLFTSEYRNTQNFTETLQFPIEYIIIPEIIAGVGWPIVNVAVFEFISAQSPHTMKGLLLGVFYFFNGFYNLISCLAVFPFTLQSSQWIKISPYLECGFLYYIFNSLLGVVFIVAAVEGHKWYKYRQREDKPYDHRYVEDYYRKYINKRCVDGVSEMETSGAISTSNNYGTIQK